MTATTPGPVRGHDGGMKIDFGKIRTHKLEALAEASVARARKSAQRAINDSLFDVRKLTPTMLTYIIDEPAPFTLRGITVQKATDSDLSGRLSLGSVQSAYLMHGEEGDPDDGLVVPMDKKARDKRGNLLRKFRKPLLEETLRARVEVKNKVYKGRKARGKGVKVNRRRRLDASHEVSRYFIGQPGRGPAGIYERHTRNKKLRLIAKFIKRRDNNAQFQIRETWNSEIKLRFKENFRLRMSGARR